MEVNNSQTSIFQIDSDLVLNAFNNNNNYLIEYNENVNKEYCIIYFSSNNIYYPNEPSVFEKEINVKNKYEWYHTRIQYGHKHIFLRDIKKQWYLEGINEHLSSPYKLLEFLKNETKGYKIICIGSSAGGYASVVYGQQINAHLIYTFNGQFELFSLLSSSNPLIDPIIFKNKNDEEISIFYDSLNFIENPSSILYFYSNKSQWDISQYKHTKHLQLNVFSFNTSHHGIPFLKCNLPGIFAMNIMDLKKLSREKINPIIFSLKLVGLVRTIQGIYSQLKK